MVVVVAVLLGLGGCSGSVGNGAASTTTVAPRVATSTTVVRTSTPTRAVRLSAALIGAPLPQPLSRAVVVATGDHLRVLGGRTAAHVSTNEVVTWSPGTPASLSGQLARRVHDSAGVVVGGHTLLFGGGDGGSVTEVQEVDAGGTGQIVGHLPTGRSDLCAAVIGATAYVIGGFDDTNGVLDVLATTDGRSFTTAATLPSENRYGAAVTVGHRVLVFGGEDANGSVDAVLAINPASHAVTRVGTVPVRLSHAAAFVVRGQVYVAGGETDGSRIATIWRYDVATGAFTEVGHLPDDRSDAAVVVLGDTAYLVGGETPNTVDTVVAVTVS